MDLKEKQEEQRELARKLKDWVLQSSFINNKAKDDICRCIDGWGPKWDWSGSGSKIVEDNESELDHKLAQLRKLKDSYKFIRDVKYWGNEREKQIRAKFPKKKFGLF